MASDNQRMTFQRQRVVGLLTEHLDQTGDGSHRHQEVVVLEQLYHVSRVHMAQLDALDELTVMAAYVVRAGLRSRLHDYLANWRFVRAETTGDDLVAQGLTPGPRFKEILWEVRAARLEGQVADAQGEQAVVRRMLDGH